MLSDLFHTVFFLVLKNVFLVEQIDFTKKFFFKPRIIHHKSTKLKQQQQQQNPNFFVKKLYLTHNYSSLWSLEMNDSCASFGEWHRTSQFRSPMVKMKESGNADWSLWVLMWFQFCCWLCVVVRCHQVHQCSLSMWNMEVTLLEYHN